ncbi:polysaccharide pyruvyl transferase family protein [Flavobacterium xanthum]|uniref:Polysaccharide pyruvyl transferase n=1 Tax=Flavobacterium xanthum TaxID=69322 RepID=A0A1M6YBN5_9FLAO|nr:polysaccharide pyruvyl transferase family protein [Flavobacterium xanthum]SHL15681.1 Polysaccharide pyruvyl transferase [Flavobacterium xanthum]
MQTILNYLKWFFYYVTGSKPIKVYYWKQVVNFGDLITRDLLRNYGFTPVWFNEKRADLISTGSLIEHLSPAYDGTILGTGAIDSNTKIQFLNAKIIGLRGKYTKRNLGIVDTIVLGDPGLLADRLIQKDRSFKKFELGIIPHYSDANNAAIQKLKLKYGSAISIINVRQQPITVLKEMDACKHIISSSLHGLICADSLGIPNRWIKLSELLGNDFKFNDYYSVFDITPEFKVLTGSESIEELILMTESIAEEKVTKIKIDLETQFLNLKL